MTKIKYIIMLAIGFIFLNLIIFIFTQENRTQRINLSLKSHIDKLQTHYEILRYQQKLTANGAYTSTMKKPQVIETLEKAYRTKDPKQRDILRAKLYDLLKDRYERLVVKGVLQYHFVFPNNEVFLRFHKPNKYGDNLTGIRSDFEYTNKTLKRVTGFAQGRTSHAFRHVYPIMDKKNNHIGAIEISFSSEGLQENFTLISKMHTHFLVDKDIFDAKAWERDDLIVKYSQSAEHENHMITLTNQHTKDKCIVQNKINLNPIHNEIDKNINKGKKFSIYTVDKNDKVLVLSFLPVYGNIENKILAWIVSHEEDKFIAISLKNTYFVRITLFIILSVLFYFIYRTLNQKEILKDLVDKKTIELKDINEHLEQKVIVEVEKNKNIQDQLFKSEKMAAMGEMISNIAHQWRQPLSAISTGATALQIQKEYGKLTDEYFEKTCDLINKNAQFLSKTIDSFGHFIKGDMKKVVFDLKEDINSFLTLVESSTKNTNINIILNLEDDIKLKGYPNELSQCFINIYDNSKDVFKTVEYDKYIFITTSTISNNIVIKFKDNAGGIPQDILPKIYEPYFTTKHQSQGTGLGLHMTYKIIVDGMNGTIEAKNKTYEYNGKKQIGVEFIVTIPFS